MVNATSETWTSDGVVLIDSVNFSQYSLGTATLLIEADITQNILI